MRTPQNGWNKLKKNQLTKALHDTFKGNCGCQYSVKAIQVLEEFTVVAFTKRIGNLYYYTVKLRDFDRIDRDTLQSWDKEAFENNVNQVLSQLDKDKDRNTLPSLIKEDFERNVNRILGQTSQES